MKSNRTKLLTAFALAALPSLFAEDANAAAATGGGDPAAGAAAEAARKRAPASNFLPIVRGRIPLIFVHAVRFDKVLNAMGNKDLATKFATSVGKIFDIKKGRNFAYVTEGFKPTAEDLAAAEGWIKQVGEKNSKDLAAAGDKSLMQKTLDAYKERGLATAEEAAAFSASRTVVRKPAENKGAAAPAAAAGAASEGAQAAASGKADDLLS